MGVASGTQMGLGIYNLIQSSKDKLELKNAFEELERQELENSNVYENMRIATMGSDLQREEQARLASTQMDALTGAGVRGVIGGTGRVQANSDRVNNQIASDLERQEIDRERLIAGDEANIRSMIENREQNDINALSSQYNTAVDSQQMAFGNILSATGSMENQLTDGQGAFGAMSSRKTGGATETDNTTIENRPQFVPTLRTSRGLNPRQIYSNYDSNGNYIGPKQ
jgi:hypothetical protein